MKKGNGYGRIGGRAADTESVGRGLGRSKIARHCNLDRAVEYFIPMAHTGPRGDSHHQLEGMFKKVRPARPQPF